MSSTRITVVVEGPSDPKQFTFEEPARCVIGRAEDCQIQFLPQPEHANVSRHHCVLDIDPPTITVRDLGSRNGTYVNGEKIGQRATRRLVAERDLETNPALPLKDGDEVRVGDAILRVGIGRAPATPEPLSYPWSLPFFK